MQFAREANGPVLELGCGTGRVLIPCSRAGAQVTGIDGSPSMLDVLRRNLARENRDVQDRISVRTATLTEFILNETFPLITMPFRPFQHLVTVDEQLACLNRVRDHLDPGGRFVFDVFNPFIAALASTDTFEREAGNEFLLPDGRRVIGKDRFVSRDLFHQVNHVEMIYEITYSDGRTERFVHAFPMRFFFRYEVEHILARSGFEVEAVYGDFAKTLYGENDYPGNLIFVASKPAR